MSRDRRNPRDSDLPSVAWLLCCLRSVVERLAAGAKEQNDYVAWMKVHTDELALELDDVLPAISWRGALSDAALASLNVVDSKLSAMSGAAHADLWSSVGVATDPDWNEVRRLAGGAYAHLPELSQADAVSLLVRACKEFQPAWEKHQQEWGAEPAGHYNDLGALATWLVTEVGAGRTECLRAVARVFEDLLATRDRELRELLVVGFLEDVQNVAVNGGLSPDIFGVALGPRGRMAWDELVVLWHGKDRSGWPGAKLADNEEFEGRRIEYQIALPNRDRILLLAFVYGGPKTQQNLIKVDGSGLVLWRADPPDASAGDSWVSIDDTGDGNLMANSWSGWRVRIDPETGLVTSKQFVK